MNSLRESSSALSDLVPYDPKYLPADILLSANENSEDIPLELRDIIEDQLSCLPLNRYPDPLANELRDEIACGCGLRREEVLLGNGGDELLFNIALAWGGPGRTMLNIPPTFSVYAHNARITHTEIVEIPRKADFTIDEDGVCARLAQGDISYVVITSPNNPTGDVARRAFVERVLNSSNALVLLDEAYGEFSASSMVDLLATHKNLAILHTFSKAYSLAGLRLGYLLANSELIGELCKVRQPYSVDAISQTIGLAVYENRHLFTPRIDETIKQRKQLFEQLENMPEIQAYPSEANYILFKVADAQAVWQALLNEGILIRDFSQSAGLENCLRVTVGSFAENQSFVCALARILATKGERS